MKSSVDEIAHSVSAPEVPDNPTESTFTTAGEVKIFIHYAENLIVVSQFPATMCAKVVHRFEFPSFTLSDLWGTNALLL